jgi:hypothetical protein
MLPTRFKGGQPNSVNEGDRPGVTADLWFRTGKSLGEVTSTVSSPIVLPNEKDSVAANH